MRIVKMEVTEIGRVGEATEGIQLIMTPDDALDESFLTILRQWKDCQVFAGFKHYVPAIGKESLALTLTHICRMCQDGHQDQCPEHKRRAPIPF